MSRPFTFYEFFAGGGMARVGLGPSWRCVFANERDPAKIESYRANFPGADAHLVAADVWSLEVRDLPGRADLAWASSPCQDLSLAGARAGLDGGRSSAFWGFWRLMQALHAEGRAPAVIVVENVAGLATAGGGRDFAALGQAMGDLGYAFGAVEMDAADFTPQSRPRLFVVAARQAAGLAMPRTSDTRAPGRTVQRAFDALPEGLRGSWIRWDAPAPAKRNIHLDDIIEPTSEAAWDPPTATDRLLGLMTDAQRRRLRMSALGGLRYAALFRRTRYEAGVKTQRAEARVDGLAGCLRTPAGGSSRQTLLELDPDGTVRSRRFTGRECARLMGLPDDYRLPKGATKALHLLGDGVAAPVVAHLARHVLEPLLSPEPAVVAAE